MTSEYMAAQNTSFGGSCYLVPRENMQKSRSLFEPLVLLSFQSFSFLSTGISHMVHTFSSFVVVRVLYQRHRTSVQHRGTFEYLCYCQGLRHATWCVRSQQEQRSVQLAESSLCVMYLVRAFAPVTVTLLVVVRAQVRFSPFRRQIAAVAAHVHHNLHLYTTIQSTLVHHNLRLYIYLCRICSCKHRIASNFCVF